MGIFDILSGKTRSNKTVYIDSSLGNVLMTGNSPKGCEKIMSYYANDVLNKGGLIIVFRDVKKGFSSYPSITSNTSTIYEINNEDGAFTESIDVFSGLSDSEHNQAIINIFDKYNEIDRSKKMSFQNYIALTRNLLKKRSRILKLNELEKYTIEEVENLNYTISMPDAERMRNERFLNSMRNDIVELESYFYEFSDNMIGEIFSGSQTLDRIFSTKRIIEISLDFASKPKESEIIMNTIVNTIHKSTAAALRSKSIAIIASEVPNEILISSGLSNIIRSSYNCKVLYSVTDISNLIEKSNEWIEYADSYFFFKQNSNKNKEFCSEFFGTYEKTKESRTSSVSNPSFFDRLNGRGSSSKSSGVTYTTEKERVYLPDVFSMLPENEAIYYFKSDNTHSKLTVF